MPKAEADHQLHPPSSPGRAPRVTSRTTSEGLCRAGGMKSDQVDPRRLIVSNLVSRIQRVIAGVAARGVCRDNRPPAAISQRPWRVGAEQACKAGVGIERRPAQPSRSRPSRPTSARCFAIADQAHSPSMRAGQGVLPPRRVRTARGSPALSASGHRWRMAICSSDHRKPAAASSGVFVEPCRGMLG